MRKLVDKFPTDIKLLNDYGVTNLIANSIEEARSAFKKVASIFTLSCEFA